MTTALSKIAKELKHQEEIIQDGMQSFLHVGRALLAIRDQELYLEEYDTFDAYCKDRWNFTRQRAYQYIEGAEITYSVSTIVDTTKAKIAVLPSNEAQARALAASADDAEDRAKVWSEAVKQAPKNSAGEPVVTARLVKQVADELFGPPKPLEEQAEENRQPKGGTSFDPSEWEGDAAEPEEPDRAVPDYLIEVVAGRAEFKSILAILAQLKGRLKKLADQPGGSWLQRGWQDTERVMDQLRANIKFAQYYAPCPRCEGKIKKDCDRCKGRRWITMGMKNGISDIEKAWLKKNI